MKNTIVLTVGLCLLLLSARSQVRDLPGYIVRNSGDTVHGFLREQGTDESARSISFKASATDNDYQVYTPAEVKSYQYTDGNLFRAITYPDSRTEERAIRTCYGKLLVSGEYDLYSFTESEILYFLVRKDTSYYLMYDDDLHSIPWVTGNFRNELNFFAVSCDAAKEEVDRTGYNTASVMEFFQKLDACLNPGKAVTSYYHKAKVDAGLFAYAGGIPLGNGKSQVTAEIRLRLVAPQVNPNMSFNVGLRYAELKRKETDPYYLVAKIYHNVDYQTTSVPVTVQYNLTRGVVQPFVFAGASLCTLNIATDDPALISNPVYYHRWAVSPLVGGGVEVRLVHVLWVRAEWRYECMVQYPTVGLELMLP